MDVRIGTIQKFGCVDLESTRELEKALQLTGLKVFGREFKLEKLKGKNKKNGNPGILLAKRLPSKVT